MGIQICIGFVIEMTSFQVFYFFKSHTKMTFFFLFLKKKKYIFLELILKLISSSNDIILVLDLKILKTLTFPNNLYLSNAIPPFSLLPLSNLHFHTFSLLKPIAILYINYMYVKLQQINIYTHRCGAVARWNSKQPLIAHRPLLICLNLYQPSHRTLMMELCISRIGSFQCQPVSLVLVKS